MKLWKKVGRLLFIFGIFLFAVSFSNNQVQAKAKVNKNAKFVSVGKKWKKVQNTYYRFKSGEISVKKKAHGKVTRVFCGEAQDCLTNGYYIYNMGCDGLNCCILQCIRPSTKAERKKENVEFCDENKAYTIVSMDQYLTEDYITPEADGTEMPVKGKDDSAYYRWHYKLNGTKLYLLICDKYSKARPENAAAYIAYYDLAKHKLIHKYRLGIWFDAQLYWKKDYIYLYQAGQDMDGNNLTIFRLRDRKKRVLHSVFKIKINKKSLILTKIKYKGTRYYTKKVRSDLFGQKQQAISKWKCQGYW